MASCVLEPAAAPAQVQPPLPLPCAAWNEQVAAYLSAALGEAAFQRIRAVLAVPPLSTCLRINTLKASPQEVLRQLRQLLDANGITCPISQHPQVPALLLRGSGPHALDAAAAGATKEVVVSRKAAESVLRGAHVFVPGVLACSTSLAAGDAVMVTVARDLPGSVNGGITRGTTLPASTAYEAATAAGDGNSSASKRAAAVAGARLCVGIGRAALSRADMFKAQHGVAVHLEQRLYNVPPFNGELKGSVMLQNLPSIVAACVLNPSPGSHVLDMCAAPGGKTTMLAQLMGGEGTIVAFDRSHAKVDDIRALAEELGCSGCVRAFKMDATKAVARGSDAAGLAAAAEQQQQEQERALEVQLQQLQHAGQQQRQAQQGQPEQHFLQLQLQQLSLKAQARLQRRLAAMRQHGHAPTAAELRSVGLGPTQHPGFPPGSFDYVLLDAPCTALGLRPRLEQQQSLQQLLETAVYQRQLMGAAVQLLKPNGTLVYSTCTINPAENEVNVRYALSTFPCLRLVPAEPRVGGPGLTGPADARALGEIVGALSGSATTAAAAAAAGSVPHAAAAGLVNRRGDACVSWLSPEEASMVQRFDPSAPADTTGFFIAKFRKVDGELGMIV